MIVVLVIAVLAVGVVITRLGMAVNRLHQSNVRFRKRGPGLP